MSGYIDTKHDMWRIVHESSILYSHHVLLLDYGCCRGNSQTQQRAAEQGREELPSSDIIKGWGETTMYLYIQHGFSV